ncbi:MAG: G-D-S-L family lipolytic protein [Cytophagales bacterium]|nr:G-D-S-L family lipolytic protein [Cytophagales bacterium]
MEIKRCIFTLLLANMLLFLQAQDPLRFRDEINALLQGDSAIDRNRVVLFTGSSSIRLWPDLKASFPKHNTLNRGFGGSEMSDLLYYASSLILAYKPEKIFIYEGDNDLNAGKSAEEILTTANQLLQRIRKELPACKVIFIAAKPSPARWQLKAKYENFNVKLAAWTKTQSQVYFADIWKPMLDKNGAPMQNLFLEDNLHMNEQGYAIWTKVLVKFL